MINSQKFNEQNPMFYAYVEMLGALVKEGVLKTSSDSKSTLLLYKTNLPTTFTQGTPLEGKTEGWVAENIFSVAQSLFNNKDERAEFYKTIKEKGIIPTFNENGTFKCLTKRAVPNDTHFGIHVGDYVYEPWFTRGSMIIHKVKSFTDSSEKNSPTKVNLELVVGDDDERCRKFFLKDEIGEDRIISAVVHMDEATPHMHLVFCPINKDGKLSAKSILGNQKNLSEWQTRYYNYMHERWNELERGKSAQETKRKHIPTWLFKLADNLDNLYNQLLKKIENINMIGMKKNKEEAIDLLSEFVPKAEKFSAKVNSYNDYINELEERVLIQRKNNRELAEQNLDLKEKIENKDLEVSERIRLMQNQVNKYERLIKKVPEDIIEKIQKEERNRKNRER